MAQDFTRILVALVSVSTVVGCGHTPSDSSTASGAGSGSGVSPRSGSGGSTSSASTSTSTSSTGEEGTGGPETSGAGAGGAGASSSSSAGAGGGGPVVGGTDVTCSFNVDTLSYCVVAEDVAPSDVDQFSTACTAAGGMVLPACPTTGSLGTCAVTKSGMTYATMWYMGLTSDQAETACGSQNGTWTAP